MTDGRSQLEDLFRRVRNERRAALLPYLTAGLPDIAGSVEVFTAMAEAGADGFEVGIPYSDPLMDGPVIMRAGQVALERGVTLDVSLGIIAEVVSTTGKPVIAMTYVNPVLRHGAADFFARVAASGASGAILADLPADEAEPFLQAASTEGLGLALFVAPTTGPDRLRAVVDAKPSFIYGVAEVGVTGERDGASENIASLSAAVRAVTDIPLVFGVGISTAEHAAAAARHGEGVIVGSAIVRRVLEAGTAREAIATLDPFVRALATAVGDL